MKKDISRNVTLGSDERVVKHFKNLKAVGTDAQVMLTTKRLIIYTKGLALNRGKKVRQKLMNEIDLHSIHRFEYFEEETKNPIIVRIIGLLIFASLAYGFYLYYLGTFEIPTYPYQTLYTDYAGFGLFAFLGLFLIFHTKKRLYMKVKSGLQEMTSLRFYSNKYNELSLRFLAGKIHGK